MFYIDGVSNVALGVIAEEEDFEQRAPLIYDSYAIPGKDGNIYSERNYGNVVSSLSLQLINMRKLDDVYQMFTGKRTICFKGRKSIFYFYDQLETSRFGIIKKIKAPYIREPFWYLEIDNEYPVDKTIMNSGNIYARPLIKLVGTGSIDMSINNVRFQYTFDSDGYVYIDCDDKKEYTDKGSKSKNIHIGFEYPLLNPGSNKVTIHSGECKIYIQRKDRWR